MRAAVHGRITRPAAVVVGAWDPFVGAHRALFDQLAEQARAQSLDPVAIVLDPSPVLFLHGRSEYPVYDDIHSRLRLMLGSSLEGVVRVLFTRRDVDGTAAELLDAVFDAGVEIRELWLGERQSLGPGPSGTPRAIRALGKRHGFSVVHLPSARFPKTSVRELLREGRLVEARAAVGHPPLRSRPRGSSVSVAWRTGPYRAVPVTAPDGRRAGEPLMLDLIPGRGRMATFEWPGREVHYLAFLSGPGDNGAVDA